MQQTHKPRCTVAAGFHSMQSTPSCNKWNKHISLAAGLHSHAINTLIQYDSSTLAPWRGAACLRGGGACRHPCPPAHTRHPRGRHRSCDQWGRSSDAQGSAAARERGRASHADAAATPHSFSGGPRPQAKGACPLNVFQNELNPSKLFFACACRSLPTGGTGRAVCTCS